MTFKETLLELMENALANENHYNFRNNIDLSGYLIKKPHFTKHDITGVESCSFILYQPHQVNGTIKVDSFSCITYVKELVEQFKTCDKVLFLATVGKLRYSQKMRGDYSQVVEVATLCEFDLPLAD